MATDHQPLSVDDARTKIDQIRQQIGARRSTPNVVDVDTGTSLNRVDQGAPDAAAGNVEELDAVRAKYEMELGAHRETTERLLTEKDRTIESQRELIDALKAQVERLAQHTTR